MLQLYAKYNTPSTKLYAVVDDQTYQIANSREMQIQVSHLHFPIVGPVMSGVRHRHMQGPHNGFAMQE